LYASGVRVSELCELCWKDVQARGDTGQITVFGKGEKTRHVLLRRESYEELVALREDAPPDAPVFRSRGGGRGKSGRKLDASQVFRIVEAAAIRAKVATYTEPVIQDEKQVKRTRSRVSPHWLRHAHASHALDNGASIAVVKETLGHESIETTAGYTHVRPGTSSSQFLKI
jgi:integrase/recombinase XerD